MDYDDLWYEYSGEFNEKLESRCGSDWDKLDETEQEIAALWKLTVDMYSGGFDEFFINWGYDCYLYAMRGIKRLADENKGLKKQGCIKIYELFETAYTKVFARFENDKSLKSYADILGKLNEEDEKLLEKTYDTFDEKLGPLLCQRAYEFYFGKLKKKPL